MKLVNMSLMFGTLGLAAALAGSTHTVHLSDPAMVNGVSLKPGDYRVEVEGNKAVIKRGKEKVEAVVQTEKSDHKFDLTSVIVDNSGTTPKVKEIDLGGTNERLLLQSNGMTSGGTE